MFVNVNNDEHIAIYWKSGMTEHQQIKNIIAFLSILFGESALWEDEIMEFYPDYLIDKFNRYIHSAQNQSDWGLNPSLRRQVFNRYCEKYDIQPSEFMDE
jgi:hypothetical protein